MKKKVIAVMSVLITIIFAAAAWAAPAFMTISAGKPSGANYAIGGAIADAITAKNSNFKCLVEAGSSSVANANLVGTAGVEIAFMHSDVAYWAYNGDIMFQGKALKKMRAVAALYPENIHLLATLGSGVASVSDLAGKRVGLCTQAAGIEGNAQSLLEVAELSFDDLEGATLMAPRVMSSRFGNDQIDAAFTAAPYPDATAAELVTSGDVTLVSFDDEYLAKLSAKYPYFVSSVIPGGTYDGISGDVKTPAVMTVLVANDEVPDSWIYEFLTVMFDNLGAINDASAMKSRITLEGALEGLTLPLHPGAEKFYKEKGLIE